jgi:hypothetical protein
VTDTFIKPANFIFVFFGVCFHQPPESWADSYILLYTHGILQPAYCREVYTGQMLLLMKSVRSK